MNNRSVVLIEVIIIIVILAIVTFGITVYVTEGLRYSISNINQEKALYMAQAGVMAAIFDYKDDGAWSSVENVNVNGEFYYHAGGDNSNFLLVDASNSRVSGKNLFMVPIHNISTTDTITITDMVVNWDFGGSIKKVRLGGVRVWDGTASSGDNLDIDDFSIDAGVSYTGADNQKWSFSKNITSGFDVVVTFIFSDGSSQKVILAKNQRSGNNEFSIKATGEIRSGSKVEARRTLLATYDVNKNEITSWEETIDHIIP